MYLLINEIRNITNKDSFSIFWQKACLYITDLMSSNKITAVHAHIHTHTSKYNTENINDFLVVFSALCSTYFYPKYSFFPVHNISTRRQYQCQITM